VKIRLLLAALLIGAIASAADLPSRLQYPAPEKWSRSVQPNSPVVTLTAPDGNASVSFAASVEFAGSTQAWLDRQWNEILGVMKPAGPVLPGEQGKFLTRTAVFQHPNGSKPWACVYALVKDGRGECVLFLASAYDPFIAHLNTVNQMVHRITVGPANPPTQTTKANSPAVSPAAVAPTATPPHSPGTVGGVDGLYLATTRQLRFNALGGSGSTSWETATEFYLLSRDGRVFRGRDLPQAPNGDISRFDYAAAQREAPGNYGTYVVRGDEVTLKLGDATGETIVAKRSGPDGLEIRGTTFKRGIRGK
jgi:hypothetical protein